MHWRQISILLLFPALLAALSAFRIERPSSGPEDPWQIEASKALQLQNVLWVDNRSTDAYQQGHVPSAIHLDPSQPEAGWQTLLVAWDPDREIVVYCAGSTCDSSRELAAQLRAELGDASVFWVKGGWPALEKGLRP